MKSKNIHPSRWVWAGSSTSIRIALLGNPDIQNLKYFRVTSAKIAGVPVDISRTGYTGDLGYEIWVASDQALKVWDALIETDHAFHRHHAAMHALV